jgi:DNA modification methylase
MKKYNRNAARKAVHKRALRAKQLPTVPQAFRLLGGDCKARLKELTACSVDVIVTDPPYELGFCGKQWDKTGIAYDVEVWRECLRVLKPGGHLFAFGATRTYHRMACAVEDAGFEIRDCLGWHYGVGFAKSKDVSKGIDAFFGEERKVVGKGTSWNRPDSKDGDTARMNASPGEYDLTAPATPQAEQWDGHGSALKPSFEPIVMARKPFAGSMIECVLEHGTGSLNVDACRVGDNGGTCSGRVAQPSEVAYGHGLNGGGAFPIDKGRWPANTIFTHSQGCADQCVDGCPVKALGVQSGNPQFFTVTRPDPPFLYTAKASTSERERGCELLGDWWKQERKNDHTTVKPLAVVRWLVRLGTPPGGVVLDPFTGSGTTGAACALEGFSFVGVELIPHHVRIAEARINYHAREASTATRVAVS